MNEEDTPCPPQQLMTAKIVNISVVVKKAKEDRLVTFTESALHMELLHTCRTHKTDHVQKVEWSKGTLTRMICTVYPTYMHSLGFIWPYASILARIYIHTCKTEYTFIHQNGPVYYAY